ATYLVRRGMVEITTGEGASPERQAVRAAFVKRPLEEALEELSDQTGISIVLDARAGDRGRTPVTASFRSEVSLLNAGRLLAGSGGGGQGWAAGKGVVRQGGQPAERGGAAGGHGRPEGGGRGKRALRHPAQQLRGVAAGGRAGGGQARAGGPEAVSPRLARAI